MLTTQGLTLSIPLKVTLDQGITPTEFVICRLIYDKDFESLEQIAAILGAEFPNLMVRLQDELDLIKIGFPLDVLPYEFSRSFVRQKFLNLFELEYRDYFSELLAVYPKQTPNKRRLHLNLAKAKEKYLKAIRDNPGLHDVILQSVRIELRDKLRSDSLNFMQNIATYVNQHNWTPYLEEAKKQLTERETNIDSAEESINRTKIL